MRIAVALTICVATSLLGCAGADGQQMPADAVLVGHWSFEEGEGQWTADGSDFAQDAFLGLKMEEDAADPQWVTEGKQGTCLRFDGETDRVTVQDAAPLHLGRGVIVEAWVKQTERSHYARVLDKGTTFDLYVHETGWVSFRTRGAEAHGVHSAEPIPLNEWVKIRGEIDGASMRLFVNDELVSERDYQEPMVDDGVNLVIGNARQGRPFCGLIDEVKIWNLGYVPPAALRAHEPDEQTVGLWHLDSAETPDSSAQHNHGELLNGEVVRGRIGQAIKFSGDGCVRVADDPSLDLTRELSIEASFNQHQRGRYARIIEKSDWTWGLWIDDRGYVDFFFKTTDGAWHHNITMTAVPLRRWVHVRAEFDGLEAVVHLDGEEAVRNEMGPGQDELLVSDGDLYIGNRHLNDRGFVGVIDEVRVSNRVRSERPPLVMKISPFHSLGSWKVRANVRGMDQPITRLTGAVRAADAEEALYTFSIDELDRGLGVADIPVGQPAPGAYTVSVVAEGADGREIAKQEAQVIVPDATPWLEAKAGVTDEVLPPWTPLAVHEGADVATVECWGRKYELRAGGLPAQVATAGQGILAGEAVVTLDAGEISWQSPEVLESTDSRVVLGSSGEGARCGLKMRTQVEFDGMVRYDLEIEPPEDGVELQELLLEIPLVAARATLMHHPMGRWFEDQTCAGAVPQEGWQRENSWYLWVGDEDRGLCWFAEDQAAWGLDDEKPGISLTPEGDRTVLRVWLINGGAELNTPRKFTWGLMATPVKPMPADWRAWRFGSPGLDVNVGVRWSTKQVTTWHSFPVPPDREAYLDIIAEAHAKGQRIVPYTNFNMQSNTGEVWDYFGAQWDAHAGRGTAADVLGMDLVNIRCCAMTGSWVDFITWKYQQFLQEYDSDGFYLDNSIPSRCRNAYHPQEHKDRIHIFGARELMKRVYAITKLNDPSNVMVCHMSSRLCIPLLSFCDAYVDGEQYSWALKEFNGSYLDLTSLARVRAELMGRQWGLIPLFLPEIKGWVEGRNARTREMLALLLPHGTRFWAGACDRDTLFAALDAIDGFGLVEAEFLPYWSNAAVLSTQSEEVIVSGYARDHSVLLIVSNLGDEAREVSVRVDLPALGVGPGASAQDILDGSDVSIRNGQVTVAVPLRDFRLIVVRGAGK